MHTHAEQSPAAGSSPGDANATSGARDADQPGGTFTLRLRISGLCLFVPEPGGGAGRPAAVHVLMLNFGDDTPTHGWSGDAAHAHHNGTDHEGMHHEWTNHDGSVSHPKHYSMLYVDEACLVPHQDELTGNVAGIPLKDTVLRLPEAGAGIADREPLPCEVLPLHEVSAVRELPRSWIGPNPGRQIAARVVLTAGRLTPIDPAATSLWNVHIPGIEKPEEWPIANHVEWTATIPGESLTIQLRDIDTSERLVRERTLFSKVREKDGAKARELRLHLVCLPIYELPGAGPARAAQAGDLADHFAGFFTLFPRVTPVKLVLKNPSGSSYKTSRTARCTGVQMVLGAPQSSAAGAA